MTNKNILNFIEVYRNNEIKWDLISKNYFNKILKNDAWNNNVTKLSLYISTEISVDEYQKKITSLLSVLSDWWNNYEYGKLANIYAHTILVA